MFELEKFFSGIVKGSNKESSKSSRSSKSRKSFLSDSLKVSLVISVIVILIIYLIFKDAVDEDENFFSIMFKSGLFILATILGGVFIHSKHLENVYEEKYSDKSSKETIERGTKSDLDDVSLTDLQKARDIPGTSGTPGSDTGNGTPGTSGTSSVPGTPISGQGEILDSKGVQVNVNINSDKLPKSGAFLPPTAE